MFQGRDYCPTELLDLCTVSRFDVHGTTNDVVAEILALVVVEKDPQKLRESLGRIVEANSRVSIGMALSRLFSISSIGEELQGGLDGLDALTYHLSGGLCKNGIDALQAVLKRFDDDKKKEEEHARARMD